MGSLPTPLPPEGATAKVLVRYYWPGFLLWIVLPVDLFMLLLGRAGRRLDGEEPLPPGRGGKLPGKRDWLFAAAFAAGHAAFQSMAFAATGTWGEFVEGVASAFSGPEAGRNAASLVTFSLAAMLVPVAACEEYLFRGFVQRAMATRWGATRGVLASAALFALVHYSFSPTAALAVTYAFAFGALAGLAYEKTGSLWTPVLCHWAVNTLITLVAFSSPSWPIY